MHINENEDDSEFQELVSGGVDSRKETMRPSNAKTFLKSSRQKLAMVVLVALCFAIIGVILSFVDNTSMEGEHFSTSPSDENSEMNIETDHMIIYDCPSEVEHKSLNDKDDNFDDYKIGNKKHFNKTLDEARLMPMDAWDEPYMAFKEHLRPWKEEVFLPNLKSGETIYESACGEGMNLLLTTEVLNEAGIHNITIYGSDYLKDSVDVANNIWDLASSSSIANKGLICAGDSTNLNFVPSEAFDLVYTGYIDPLQDPLELNNDDEAFYDRCDYKGEEDQTSVALEQSKQEDWYASWVAEILRIAKPGKVIAIESGAESQCKQREDWGGVDRGWWYTAIDKYGWDVDPKSVVIRDATMTHSKRYHVMMRKMK